MPFFHCVFSVQLGSFLLTTRQLGGVIRHYQMGAMWMLILSVECMMPGITSSLAFTSTLLSWSVLEYSSQFSSVDLLDSTKAHIRWITDYLLKTHNSTDELYFQVCSSCNGNTLLYYYLFLPTPLFPFRSCPIYWLHCVENVLYFGMKIWLLV